MLKVNFKAAVLLLILFVIALFTGGIYIYGLFFMAFFLVLDSYITGRSSYKSLVSIVWKSSGSVMTGDKISLTMDFFNSGWLPIPYLNIKANLPKRLTGEEQKPYIHSVMPGIKATIARDFVCKHKGVYQIGFVEVEFSDIFGLFKWRKVFDDEVYLHVYPKVHMLKHIDVPVRQQFGTIAVKHNAYEDYASTKDIRKYAIGDSFKKMHWKVTAHRGEFFVRNVELNATADLNVFLDLYAGGFNKETADDIEEKGAECAVSIIRYALSNSMSVNFIAKGDMPVSLSAKGINRFYEFMDTVSKLSANGDIPVQDIVKREARKLDWDATIVVITSNIDKPFMDTFLSLKASGIEFVIIYIFENIEEAEENLEILKGSDFRVFTVGLKDDIRQVLGGRYEK
ncbi:MAG: DUF58 domain-containing protein [Caulobacteraceae bacterium]